MYSFRWFNHIRKQNKPTLEVRSKKKIFKIIGLLIVKRTSKNTMIANTTIEKNK
jgi:hypothetical protein